MAGESHIEDICYDVLSHIEDSVGTYVTAIDSAKGDFTLKPFIDFAIDDGGFLQRSKLPALLLNPLGFRELPDTTTTNLIVAELELYLIHTTQGPVARLPIQALRYAAAVRNMILADRTFGGAVDGIAHQAGEGDDVMAVQYYPRVEGDSQRKVTVVEVAVIKCVPST